MKTRREFFGYAMAPLVGFPAIEAVRARHIVDGWVWPKAALDVMPLDIATAMRAEHERSLLILLQDDPPKGSTRAITSVPLGQWNTVIVWKRNATNGYVPEIGQAFSPRALTVFGFDSIRLRER